MHRLNSKIFFVFLLILFVSIDQTSKYIIRSSGGFYICNEGAALGIKIPFLLVIILTFILLFSYYLLISKSKAQISNQFKNSKFKNLSVWSLDLICNLSFGFWILLVLSGGTSNIIDRIFFGCVIDFIDIDFWPIFNLADVYVTIGGIMIIVTTIKTTDSH